MRPEGRQRRIFVGVAIAAAAGLLWAGIRLTDRDADRSTLTMEDPGVSHVHGLGVNPADGALYIATHHGTFLWR